MIRQLVPFRRSARAQPDALLATRLIWFGIASAVPLYWFVLTYVSAEESLPADWTSYAIPALGVLVNVIVIPIGIRRMVSIPSNGPESSLVASFRAGMFLGIAASGAVALIAFATSFLTGSHWTYALSLPFTLIGLVRTGPFQRTFRRCDDLLGERGSPFRMSAAIRDALARPSEPTAA